MKYLSTLFYLVIAILAAVLAIASTSCQQATEPAPAPFIGKWADTSFAPLLFTVEFREDRTVTFHVRDAGETVSRSDGAWRYEPPRLITWDTVCQEGPPARFVPCSGKPDTVHVSISGDSWPVSFEDAGEIITLNLRRFN